jgi:uncharacterized membrane protein
VGLLLSREDAAPLDPVPLRETPTAARGGGVLRDEHRMTPKRRLLSIVPRLGGRQPLSDEVCRMREDGEQTLRFQVRVVFRPEPDLPPKWRAPQGCEEIVRVNPRGRCQLRWTFVGCSLAALTLSLAACRVRDSPQRAGLSEPPSPRAFRAVGNEPFWALEIDTAGLRFRTPDDTTGIHWPAGSARVRGDTLRWVGRSEDAEIDARIWPAQCSDGMSDRSWEYAATVRIDTATYTGCAAREPS